MSGPRRAVRILVVEDDALIQLLLCETLSSLGHEICAVAASEAEAIAAAARSQPDLMIVDSRLESGSGVGAVRQILHAHWIPHIFVSGDAMALQALDPGAVTLQKPYMEHDLVRAIARALS